MIYCDLALQLAAFDEPLVFEDVKVEVVVHDMNKLLSGTGIELHVDIQGSTYLLPTEWIMSVSLEHVQDDDDSMLYFSDYYPSASLSASWRSRLTVELVDISPDHVDTLRALQQKHAFPQKYLGPTSIYAGTILGDTVQAGAGPNTLNNSELVARLAEIIPGMNEYTTHPDFDQFIEAGDCGMIVTLKREALASTVQMWIIHMNDAHRWTYGQIAKWLDTLDIDLTVQEPTPIERQRSEDT